MNTENTHTDGNNEFQNDSVLHLKNGQISTVKLNRPERMNAIDPPTHRKLRETLEAADLDPDTRAIVITGAGRAFCAGGDVKSMAGDNPFGGTTRVLSLGRDLVDTMIRIEKPLVAQVNGAAVGLGATVALLCDVVYMAESAKIGDRHVNVGLVAGDGGAAVWPLLIGPARAKELLMTGRMLSASEAAEMGLVSRVIADVELGEQIENVAAELCALPPYAVRATKAAVNKILQTTAADVLDLSLAYEHLSMETEDHQEALRAQREKRVGQFTGK